LADLDGRGVSEFRKLVHEFMWNFQEVHITQGDLIGKAVIASWVTQSINLHLRCGMASNRATIIGEGGQNHPIQVLQLHIWIYPSCHIGQLAGMFLHFDSRASWCPTYQILFVHYPCAQCWHMHLWMLAFEKCCMFLYLV
jgi:hypothetical protein